MSPATRRATGANRIAINDFAYVQSMNDPSLRFERDGSMQRDDIVQTIKDEPLVLDVLRAAWSKCCRSARLTQVAVLRDLGVRDVVERCTSLGVPRLVSPDLIAYANAMRHRLRQTLGDYASSDASRKSTLGRSVK
jgi:hypothetical protein